MKKNPAVRHSIFSETEMDTQSSQDESIQEEENPPRSSSINFKHGDYVVVQNPNTKKRYAAWIRLLPVKPDNKQYRISLIGRSGSVSSCFF